MIYLSDPKATKPAQTLYQRLAMISKSHTLIGQQDALAYGVGRRSATYAWRSDMADVCGKFPAVFGWDFGHLGLDGRNLDGVDFGYMKLWMSEVYRRGGINTVSWHMRNPLTGGDAWDTGLRVVKEILPGGSKQARYLSRLDRAADFITSLTTPSDLALSRAGLLVHEKIPLIFRPFHEHTGSWFWWGQKWCSKEEFIQLWRFTVHYLRNEKGLHQLIYAYSPDRFNDRSHYLERYPGHDVVDVFGLDDYHDLGKNGKTTALVQRLRTIVELADEYGKLAALTETGYESIPEANWWTGRLSPALFQDPLAAKIAWVLLWRNDRKTHHYGPYPGHLSSPDFIAFSRDERVTFLEDFAQIEFS